MKPVLQALILADRIYEDKTTGKKVIAGTFHKLLFSKAQPFSELTDQTGKKRRLILGGMQAGSPYVYISITDLRAKAPFVLRYVNLTSNKVLFQTAFEVACPDPLQTAEIVLPLPSLPIDEAGAHALELLCNDEPMGSLRILVEEVREPQQGENDE